MTGQGLTPAIAIAALLLPPLAIFLAEGVTRNFWIAFGLTCLAFLPGVVFALVTLLKRPAAAPGPA